MKPHYRTDIDGLRAVAVLSVLFFHVGFGLFRGGYVGVDVFFVISGYLITSIILAEMSSGSFSLTRFYERRIRRILPALALVLGASLVAGALILDPADLENLGKSIVSATLFSSNVQFYLESGYFEAPSESKPLLHTWSLAVEEQYYIVYPILLLLIAKLDKGRFGRWLTAIAIASFALTVLGARHFPTANFYLLPTRAWELLIGGVLALQIIKAPRRRLSRNVLSMVGLAMIAASVLLFSTATTFPGLPAAVPTLGAALVIHADIGGESITGRLLSFKPLAFVGAISYSLYLWHWPIVVFAKIYSIVQLTTIQRILIVIATFLLSAASWKLVETPFRRRSFLPNLRHLVIVAALAGAGLVASGGLVAGLDGLPSRNTYDDAVVMSAEEADERKWGACEARLEETAGGPIDLCPIGREGREPSFVLWGDSHGMALASMIEASAERNGRAGRVALARGCPPLAGVRRTDEVAPDLPDCALGKDVLEHIVAAERIETAILVSRWPYFFNGTRYESEPGDPVVLTDLEHEAPEESNADIVPVALRRTIGDLTAAGKKIVIVLPIPEVGYDVPSAEYSALVTGRDLNALIAPSTQEYEQRAGPIRRILADIAAASPNVMLIDPYPYLCDAEDCAVVDGDVLLYRDDDHLSLRGAERLSPAFDALFSSM